MMKLPGQHLVPIFDGGDASAPFSGAYSRAGDSVTLAGDQLWKTARFRLEGARFLNSQNAGADFRLVIEAPDLIVSTLRINRP